eukprot:CAMPEP_0194205836 /NCGR_PEP_ID=MMETSP0156-20130528/5031_1 /TAXON_ID=33649 /ORGANISM="Thalassionema nitzschioides, Strain L26-B" /LENGTH=3092 /DNA_ID=CAMNT_0038932219 /DNA_START=10 /DNA_END=9288 /DNA_ORIENTATION=+
MASAGEDENEHQHPPGDPYIWDDKNQPAAEVRTLWREVAQGIDRSQTVVWKNAVESLQSANQYLPTTQDARVFVEKYMKHIIGILVEQQPSKIGQHERSCVEDSLELSVAIIATDLKIQQKRNGEAVLLEVLALVFNKKKSYYKGSKGWNVNHMSGLPEVRLRMIECFRQEGGFKSLAEYLNARIKTPIFPSLDLLHQILSALADSVPSRGGTAASGGSKEMDDDAIAVAQAAMRYISSFSDEAMRRLPTETLNIVRCDLQRIFDRLVSVRRESTYQFYEFWRNLVLQLITSQSLPLRLFGWEQLKELIDASQDHRPPAKSFIVEGAGCTFVNGEYTFAGATTSDGYSQRGEEISYERRIPSSESDGGGKNLTLFRCTMRSQQKWWFLSEADEEQPGTDRDIDYYQHKSKEHEETEPPMGGWVTCRNAGVEPSPKMQGRGLTVPKGEEYNTLEHQLAKCAIDNKIVELVLGASLHREVVHRSIPFIEFLALMCNRDPPVEPGTATPPGPNAYCLQKDHLLLAWKTCTSKADVAVSDEIYHLLVSILPSLPDGLAIPLLQVVQESLEDTKQDLVFEVAEFCAALASHTPNEGKDPSISLLSEEVRAVVLDLLWAVLTHPEASSLKSYDTLKRYFTSELRIEPFGRKHREKFLQACTETLSRNAQQQHEGGADEALALRMVKLTQFVLEACPREQAQESVMANKGALASLVFSELTAYLLRRNDDDVAMSPQQKKTALSPEVQKLTESPLSERLRILRCVYGISEGIRLSIIQLQHLWTLCSIPSDREELMVFVASASTFTGTSMSRGGSLPDQQDNLQQAQGSQAASDCFTAAFSNEVRSSAFVDLMCSETVDWGVLGESAYQSFQVMYKRLRQTPGASAGPALNALWRICLTTGNEVVASQSMKDLLTVYSGMTNTSKVPNSAWSAGPPNGSTEQMHTDDEDNDFGNRVFDYLVEVKKGLDAGLASSERSAERCLRILNAAVGQDGSTGRSVTTSAVLSLNTLTADSSLADAIGPLPHGMRGQSGYRRIGIMAKRTAQNLSQNQDQTSSNNRQASTMRFPIDVHPLETLASVKTKVSHHCQCRVSSVKPISASGRLAGTGNRNNLTDSSQMSLNVVPDDSTVDQLGIVHGCEMVFVIADRQAQAPSPAQPKPQTQKNSVLDLNKMFDESHTGFANRIFETLLSVLEALPARSNSSKVPDRSTTHKLVWDLLLAMPTNKEIAEKVRATAGVSLGKSSDDAIMTDSVADQWSSLLDKRNFQRSVYVLQTIDAFLQPAPELFSSLPKQKQGELEGEMRSDALTFRQGFIESGGFDAVVSFFSTFGDDQKQSQRRMGDAAALRILKCCLFGNTRFASVENSDSSSLDAIGNQLLDSLSIAEGLLRSLTAMVVDDEGISTSTISDVLKFLRLLFLSVKTTEAFVALPGRMAEKFLITLLLWEGGSEITRSNAAIGTSSKVRKNMHDLILSIALLARHALPWLIGALDFVDVNSDATGDYFDVLKKLVTADEEISRSTGMSMKASQKELQALGTAVCKKLASCPRPTSGSSVVDAATGVLCGCLKLLRALIENGGGDALSVGCEILLNNLEVSRWSEFTANATSLKKSDVALIDLMGVIFDGFLSPGGSSSVVSICCDKESRQFGFDAVAASARSCSGSEGYLALVKRINGIVCQAAPYLRHRWGQVGGGDDGQGRTTSRNPSKYSGLRNQGCTCYMNSFLQQLFMMNDLRKNMCAAPLPESLRSSGGSSAKGVDLIGKKLSLQWDNGASYDAIVEAYDESSGMHTIRYCPLQVASVGVGGTSEMVPSDEISRIPPELQNEFILSEGRPGKETGVFEIVSSKAGGENSSELTEMKSSAGDEIKETEDQASARHLFEEVQRTFIHLDEGSRGRCFDPRAFVEACACLKLEFDVWQQNDASEFAMKLLDRMEIALKRWAPHEFRYLEHTFGLKQTKQKICKECGLKTNREENLMSIDCQIRGKVDIHEALETMCEVEYMEGNNKVFCDRCKKNTDTVLRTAISALPDMLILSLKRFDLDYNTFETVKLNSRCAFGQTLNMKKYTLEGVEAIEKGSFSDDSNDPAPMDTSEDGDGQGIIDPLTFLPDTDYEYKLAGVLVHAGVAQGGHYYSFIKDRGSKGGDKWYKFDDEDVSPFDPSLIEVECFGGKVKKETKWPNGQVQTVESEQFANALMLFYEKVKPTDLPEEGKEKEENEDKEVARQRLADTKVLKTTGFDAFEPDVRRSNATHRWQTFLFDSEFQTFLKGLLGLCRLSRNHLDRPGGIDLSHQFDHSHSVSCQASIVDMLISFFFDVLLYASDKTSLNVWVSMLIETLSADQESAKNLVKNLAERTGTISANWLRTYVADCPEPESRIAAVRIFAAAIRSCASIEAEEVKLKRWTNAWKEQLDCFKGKLGKVPFPTALENSWQVHEGIELLDSQRASSIGAILSFINVLLEVAPRTWRYNSELCMLIRDIAIAYEENGGDALRSALNLIQVPARLICLVIRDKARSSLRASFPGASMSFELADSQARPETNPSAHLLPMTSPQMMNNDMNQRSPSGGVPVASDFLTLFEALCAIMGMKSLILAPLVFETTEQSRGRAVVSLTENASKALATIYQESCSSIASGMSQQDIEAYLHICGLDSSAVPTQKILDILTKYPSTKGSGARNGSFFLGLEGFLAYYRDTAQTNEARVRTDLHTFGYRPDLTRRPKETRIQVLDGIQELKSPVESVAADVRTVHRDNSESSNLGELALLGLDSFDLHAYAYSASEALAEYLVASTILKRENTYLITNTQKAIYRAPTAWAGNEMWEAAKMIFRVIACIEDSYQQERIACIMENPRSDMLNNQDIGLLQAAKALSTPRSNQNYSNDMQYAYEKYFDLIKELMKLKPLATWMSENRTLWSWMERDLIANDEGSSQRRSDFLGQREGIVGENTRSDNDMQGVQDSEDDDDDDDSRMYEDAQRCDKIVVDGAGLDVINGVFERQGSFEGAGKFVKKGVWNGTEETFSMFRCNVSNNTKHWYISIVPKGVQPGTNTDIDFYSAPVSRHTPDLPPSAGWTKANEGVPPCPVIQIKDDEESDDLQRGRVLSKNTQRIDGQ